MQDERAVGLSFTILLGGTPTPTPDRFGTSILVEADGQSLLLDVGPGATRRLVQAGVNPQEVGAVVFTHHHFDHNAGFPGFFLSRWDQSAGRYEELSVFGPPPTRQFLDRLFAEDAGAFWPDLRARMSHPLSQRIYENRGGTLPRLPPEPAVQEVQPGDTFSHGVIEMTASMARHVQPFLDCNAYRLEVGGGSMVYTGDTEPCDEVVELATGCDVLVSMCWDAQGEMDSTGEALGQTGTLGAARMARDAGAGSLVLTHAGPVLDAGLPPGEAKLIEAIYDGPVYLASELDAFAVGDGAVRRSDELNPQGALR